MMAMMAIMCRNHITHSEVPVNAQNVTTHESAQTTAESVEDVSADALIEEVSIDGMCGVY